MRGNNVQLFHNVLTAAISTSSLTHVCLGNCILCLGTYKEGDQFSGRLADEPEIQLCAQLK